MSCSDAARSGGTASVSLDSLVATGKLGANGITIVRKPPVLGIGIPYVRGDSGTESRIAFDNVRFDAR